MSKENFHLCDRIASIILSSTVLFAMFAFVPGGGISASVLKGYVLVVGASLSFVAWIIGRLMQGTVTAPRTWILPALGVYTLALFFSAVFSHAPYLSIFGEGLEPGAFVPSLALALILFLASVLFSTRKRISYFLSGAFVLYTLIALYQLLHVFFPGATSLGVFSSSVSTPVGSWSDFAYLSGAALAGATLSLQFWKPEGRARMIVITGAALALFFLILTNIFLAWVLAGLSVFGILLYAMLAGPAGERKPFPFLPFALTVVAIFFIIANAAVGYKLAGLLNAPYFGATPSPSATLHVALSSIHDHPFFGAGLNRFPHEWLAYRPLSVNNNLLWDTQFPTGVSGLFTQGMLAGGLGVASLLLFLAAFVLLCIKSVFARPQADEDPRTRAALFSVFLLAVYFMAAIVITPAGTSIFVLAFFLAGALAAVAYREKRIGERMIMLFGGHRAGAASIVAALLCITLVITIFLGATKRVSAEAYLESAISSANAGDLAGADKSLVKALGMANLPSLERARVVLAERALSKLIAGVPAGQDLSASAKTEAQSALGSGNTAALAAIALDTSDVQNYLVYGDLMRSLVPFGIPNAFANARDAYLEAIKASPNYPKPYLALASLYKDKGDSANARTYIAAALSKKQNYTAAYFLEERMSADAGDMKAALGFLSTARSYSPRDPDIYAEIGFLDHRMGDYAGAVAAYKEASTLGSMGTSAWYYYADSLAKTGDRQAAVRILSTLHVRMPNDTSIAKALLDLSASGTQ